MDWKILVPVPVSRFSVESRRAIGPPYSTAREALTPAPAIEEAMSELTPTAPADTNDNRSNAANLKAQPRTLGGGLSELSKQLRVLQAKNTSQTVEIDRLERQLRILADLQGVSVVDLQNALKEACQAEAFGEMQHRVASMRAELESASATKQNAAAASQNATNAKRMANLELRVGELEEVEENQREEIKDLYSKLMHQQESVTMLNVLNLQLQSDSEELKTMQQKDMAVSDEDHTNARIVLQKENSALKIKVLEATMNAKTLTQKMKLADSQREALEQQFMLRNTQFKARFMVQEDTIRDLEQQLSSLYTVFSLMRDDKVKEDKERQMLQDHLDLADSEVARQVDVLDQSARSNGSQSIFKGLALANVCARPNEPASPVPKSSYVSPQSSEIVLRGVLLVKSNLGMIRKWKKREVILFSSLSHHYLDIAGEGGIEIHVGSSRVEAYHKHPLAFLIHVGDRMVFAAAALNENDFAHWMEKLTFATTGDRWYGKDSKDPMGTRTASSTKKTPEPYPEGVIQKVPSLAECEELDLKKAIVMSQNES